MESNIVKSNDDGTTASRLSYSRDFLLKYDRYKPEPDIIALINNLLISTPRSTPIKGPNPVTNPKSSARTLYPKSNKKGTPGKPEKRHSPAYKQRDTNFPVALTSEHKQPQNDLVVSLKSNSLPAALSSGIDKEDASATSDADRLSTPRKLASSPELSSYSDPMDNLSPSKFVSLFSKPQPELCGEMNLKPCLSLDFIDDQPVTPTTTPSKIRSWTTPKTTTPTENLSPFRSSSKTPRSPHNARPISPLDEQRLVQRQKQIDYGYRTVGYLRYRLLVPKEKRKPEHPRTPKKAQGCSKRSWDGQLKKWRRDLHLWDPDNLEAFRALLNSEVVESIISANPELSEVVEVVREKLANPNMKLDDDDDMDDEPRNCSVPDTNLTVSDNTNNAESKLPKVKVARTLVF